MQHGKLLLTTTLRTPRAIHRVYAAEDEAWNFLAKLGLGESGEDVLVGEVRGDHVCTTRDHAGRFMDLSTRGYPFLHMTCDV